MKTSERLRKTALLISPDKSDRQLPSYAFRCRPRELRRLLGADQNRPRLVQIYLSRRRQLDQKLIDGVLDAFYRVRDLRGLQKKPSTSEVLDWIQALVIGGVPVGKLEKEIPFAGVLLKKTEDLKLVENNRYVY